MSYGAFMNVTNRRSSDVRTFVIDVSCVYEHGGEGSHLEDFDDRLIRAGSTYPGGGGQYIYTKNSGSCFFLASSFRLKVTDDANGAIIGTVSFVDRGNEEWSVCSNTNTDLLNVNIDNLGSQGVITVTIAAS